MVEMGKCTGCGHLQPGTRVGDRVEPLAEGGCAHCGTEHFVVADDESLTRSYGHLAVHDADRAN